MVISDDALYDLAGAINSINHIDSLFLKEANEINSTIFTLSNNISDLNKSINKLASKNRTINKRRFIKNY